MQEPFFEKHRIRCLSAFADKADVMYRDGWAIWLMRVSLNILKSTSSGKMSVQDFITPDLILKAKLTLTGSAVGADLSVNCVENPAHIQYVFHGNLSLV